MEARAEVQEFPVLILRTLDCVVGGLGSFVLFTAWTWLIYHHDVGLGWCAAIGGICALIYELFQTLTARNRRIMIDVEGVSVRNLLGRSRLVARWGDVTGVVWVVWRRPIPPTAFLALDIAGAGERPRRVRLWSGNSNLGLPIGQAIAQRLGLREAPQPPPQSPWVAAITERKQYLVWRRPGDESVPRSTIHELGDTP
jgi:hypothetical protein